MVGHGTVASLQDLGARGINELHVEAGARLMGPLIAAGLVDELLVYLAPAARARCSKVSALPELHRRGHASWIFMTSPVLAMIRTLRSK